MHASNSSIFTIVNATVNLTNINDHNPEFSQERYDALLKEDSVPGTSIVQIQATDGDADDELRYSISGVNEDWFDVDSTTGNISVSSKADFDAELLSVYFLTCLVSDGQRVSTSFLNVTITDVNDEDPRFVQSDYKFSIEEYDISDTTEMKILQVTATDADTHSPNNVLTYSIFSGNEEGKFDIHSNNGTIFRNQSIDMETERATYDLVVMATDRGVPERNGTTEVTITILDVNDNIPEFQRPVYSSEVEKNAIASTVVANVTATDADVTSKGVIYAIKGASIFVVDADGLISLSGLLDFEAVSNYNLTVTATDRDSPFAITECQVEIEVLDVNDEPPVFVTPSPIVEEVDERLCSPGTYVDKTNASNPLCLPCPINAYQNNSGHQDEDCIPCPEGLVTFEEGSENGTDCIELTETSTVPDVTESSCGDSNNIIIISVSVVASVVFAALALGIVDIIYKKYFSPKSTAKVDTITDYQMSQNTRKSTTLNSKDAEETGC